MEMMQTTHPLHYWYQMFSEPEDFGYGGVARYRTWCIGAHKRKTTILADPYELYEAIKARCTQESMTCIEDYLVATTQEIQQEAFHLALRRGKKFHPDIRDLRYLLTSREEETRVQLDRRYLAKTGSLPETDHQLIYFLGDNASYGASWSATSRKIPTFRVNAKTGIFWVPHLKRFLTAKEKLIAMGWPCTVELAKAMGLPLIGATDGKRAADLLGTAMHWQTAAIMQLIALSCFGPSDSMEDGFPQVIFRKV